MPAVMFASYSELHMQEPSQASAARLLPGLLPRLRQFRNQPCKLQTRVLQRLSVVLHQWPALVAQVTAEDRAMLKNSKVLDGPLRDRVVALLYVASASSAELTAVPMDIESQLSGPSSSNGRDVINTRSFDLENRLGMSEEQQRQLALRVEELQLQEILLRRHISRLEREHDAAEARRREQETDIGRTIVSNQTNMSPRRYQLFLASSPLFAHHPSSRAKSAADPVHFFHSLQHVMELFFSYRSPSLCSRLGVRLQSFRLWANDLGVSQWEEEIKKLFSSTVEGGVYFIYLSAHGDPTNGDLYLHDGKLQLDALVTWWDDSPAKRAGGQLLLFQDSCHGWWPSRLKEIFNQRCNTAKVDKVATGLRTKRVKRTQDPLCIAIQTACAPHEESRLTTSPYDTPSFTSRWLQPSSHRSACAALDPQDLDDAPRTWTEVVAAPAAAASAASSAGVLRTPTRQHPQMFCSWSTESLTQYSRDGHTLIRICRIPFGTQKKSIEFFAHEDLVATGPAS